MGDQEMGKTEQPTKGGYPKEWAGKRLSELRNDDGTYGKNHSTEAEVNAYNLAVRDALSIISNEMVMQVAKWGVQTHPSFRIDTGNGVGQVTSAQFVDRYNGIPIEWEAKARCEENHAKGDGTYADILMEELAEALSAAWKRNDPTGVSIPFEGEHPEDFDSDEALEWERVNSERGVWDVADEVMQVAAVAVAWYASLRYQRYRSRYEAAVEELDQRRESLLKEMRAAMEAEEYTPGGYI